MSRIKQIFIESEFVNIATMSGGVIIAQVIGFIAQPIATRLYLPEDFGRVAIIISLCNMFTSVLNGQYDLCIVSAPNDKEANTVTVLSLYIGIILSLIISLGIICFNIYNPIIFKDLGNWIYITIPLMFLGSLTNVLNSYNNRHSQYKLLAKVSLYRAFASNIIKIGLGYFRIGILGLIISLIVSPFVGLNTQLKEIKSNIKDIILVNKKELKYVAFKYKAQPMFSAPGIFVVSYSYSVIPIFINTLYGIKEVGYYSLAMAMLGLPITLIGANVGKVFFRKASNEKAKVGNFSKSFKSSLIILTGFSVVPFLTLLFFSEPIFLLVFGNQWLRSGTYIKLLIPWYWMNFIAGSLMIGLIISGKQFLKLVIQCLFVIEILVLSYIAKILSIKIETYLLSLSSLFGVTYIILLYILYRTSIASESLEKINPDLKYEI